MDDPAVHCLTCDYAWRSPIMAEGLARIGSCPRCGGELRFNTRPASEGEPAPAADARYAARSAARAPHLVLGIPRR